MKAQREHFIPLPAGFVDWVIMATDACLSCPVGRALYVANRKRHTWPGRMRPWDGKMTPAGNPMREHYKPTEKELMETMRPGTAERWLAHWLAGGSIDSLTEKTEVETLLRIQRRADAQLSEGQKLRRAFRRARRGTLIVLHDNEPDESGPPAHIEEGV